MGLVYGGAKVGLMGAVADGALSEGGETIGILPKIIADREVAHLGLSQLIPVATMHERKFQMLELADAVLALPGGFGTLDELMEAVTWAQLGMHFKPCIVVNTLGYYDGLLSFLDTAVAAGFLKPVNRQRIKVAANAREAIEMLQSHTSGEPKQ